jgi:FdhD protein
MSDIHPSTEGAGAESGQTVAVTWRVVDRVSEAASPQRSRDCLAVEAPLELRLRDWRTGECRPYVVLMRSPGNDPDLALGLLHGEGVVQRPEEVRAIRAVPLQRRPGGASGPDPAGSMAPSHPETPASEPTCAPGAPALPAGEAGGSLGAHTSILEIELDVPELARRLPERGLYMSASCGVCGAASLRALERPGAVLRAEAPVDSTVVAALPAALRRAQRGFASTGAVHAAAAFGTDGALWHCCEDVGRHNAVDKLVGWALRSGRLPLAQALLCVSGRVSFEIVQKAIAAGFPLIVAVSAPSSLAVDLAERYRVTLCGFARDGRFNVYSHSTRIRGQW